jgi:hypothetical protein
LRLAYHARATLSVTRDYFDVTLEEGEATRLLNAFKTEKNAEDQNGRIPQHIAENIVCELELIVFIIIFCK